MQEGGQHEPLPDLGMGQTARFCAQLVGMSLVAPKAPMY